MPSIFSSRSLFYRVTMEVLCQLLKSVERFQLLFIYPGTSLATTVLRSIGSDYGRPGSWCWIQQGSMAKACDLLVLFMSFSIDYCTSISSVVCVTCLRGMLLKEGTFTSEVLAHLVKENFSINPSTPSIPNCRSFKTMYLDLPKRLTFWNGGVYLNPS